MNFKKFKIIKGDHKSDKTYETKSFIHHFVLTEGLSTLNSKKLKYYVKINCNNVMPVS